MVQGRIVVVGNCNGLLSTLVSVIDSIVEPDEVSQVTEVVIQGDGSKPEAVRKDQRLVITKTAVAPVRPDLVDGYIVGDRDVELEVVTGGPRIGAVIRIQGGEYSVLSDYSSSVGQFIP